MDIPRSILDDFARVVRRTHPPRAWNSMVRNLEVFAMIISEVSVLVEQIDYEIKSCRIKLAQTNPATQKRQVDRLLGVIDGLECAKVLVRDNADYAETEY